MNRITKAKGYAQRRCDRRVISEQKDIVLEKLIAIGKRMGKLRYLMLVFLCISLCLYHFMDHVCKYLHLRRRIPKGLSKGLHKGMPRVFACYMAMVFVVTSTDLTAFAQEDNGTEILNQQTASIEALPEEQGTIVVQNPETTDGQPETTEDQSEAIEGQSETTDSQPDAIEGQPDTIEGQPEVTDGRSDAIEGQPEVTDSQSYAIEGQPETTEGQLEATEKQPEVSEPQQETTSATETSEEEQAPFSQNVIIDGISISVYAPVGVFPVGAILHVEKITNHAVVEEIEQMVSNHKSEQRIDESYTFDIQIRDEAGQEIEPDTSRGQVEVTFQNVNVMNTEEQETSVYYVADELNQVEEIKSNFNIENDSVSINAEHFSIYTVVITTAVNKETILKYYQASTIQDSYFTIYTAEELSAYKELLDKYVYYRTLNGNAQVETILVNGDDANPMEGITGVGQAANIKLSQLNLSAKVMDNITLEDAHWSPIYILPSEYYITGSGKTITFKNKSGYASENNLVQDLGGILDNIILVNGADYAKRREMGLLPETGLYATITVRVDGLKADIGKAITGAEALAISCDGENYITLERFDDMSIYRTPMDNLEVGAVYHVYYAYENQNGTISGATLTNNTPLEELTEGVNINLDYVSVRYDLEGANTFRRNGDGTLSEDVMASVRVNVQPDGTYKAQEDYEAVIKPAEGFTIPSFSKHVMISIGGHELNYNAGDFSYSISDATEEGTIRIGKEKITDSILMKVEADKIEDFGKIEVLLNTRGCGTVRDQEWDNPETSKYTRTIYAKDEDRTIILPTAGEMNTLNGTDSIRFDGWYTSMACTGSPVTQYTYQDADITDHVNNVGKKTFYAKWVLNNKSSSNGSMYYEYMNNGRFNIKGYNASGTEIKVTYGHGGFFHQYQFGTLSSEQSQGNAGGTEVSMYPTGGTGGDIFKRLDPNYDIWAALICTNIGQYTDITYIFENRGNSTYSNGLYFGDGADIMIHDSDAATIALANTGTYLTMTDKNANYTFRLYVNDSTFGVDKTYSYWAGNHSGQYKKVFYQPTVLETTAGDSAAAFSWYVNNIPSQGYVKKSTKLGIGAATNVNNIEATLSSGSFGSFAGGRQQMTLSSNSQKITVSADGKTVTAVRTSGNSVSTNPTRTSYVFEGWYLDEEATARPAKGLTFTQDIKLYAKWVPDPNKSVTNNSSIQKVNGSDNLLVPEVLGNIMLYNHTPGARVAKITQGQTVTDAAGNATNFVGELVIEGEDNRYLLPDDILVELVDDDGNVTAKLTKGTGYEYHVWNNRKNATIEVNKQFIKGNIVITAVGYELPPVTATSIRVAPAPESTDYSIQYGQKATFTASAETSQNHVVTYQWYIAPYDEITLDNFKYWTYQNQNGVALQNGTAFYTFGAGDPIEVTVSGANKSTLRISGLPVNYYGSSTDTYNNVLHLGGYHVYCVVNSVRNITGQSAIAVSDVAEVQVVKNTYAAPTGLEGSATTYYGSNDGEIVIEQQSNRPTLVYRKAGEDGWTGVTTAQLSAGKLTGLTAGTYQFKYSADTNNEESNITDVIVDDGRYILITYRATGCDNESQRLQYQHVAYNTILSDTIEVVKPEKTGYAFSRWNFPAAAVTSDVVVEAVYTNGVYGITLDGNQATTMGTTSIYERYEDGFYLEIGCHNRVSGNSGITVPTRKGYTFLGYYTAAEGGTQLICADGCLSANMSATRFLGSAILYAHWKSEPVQIQPLENILLNITPAGSQEPVTDGNFDFDTEYVVQITNQTEEEKNVIYVFSNGQLKDTIVDVTFDADNQCEFTLEPELVGGGDITVALGYVEPTTVIDEEPIEKETEELLEEAKENAEELQYSITYADVDSSRAHVDFTGSFVTAAATKGILGLKTTLPQAVKTGYTFAGWFASVRGTGTAITEIPADNMDDITVYAKWIANKYQITYVMNNGTFSEPANIPNQFQYGGTSVQLPTAAQITRENYRFLGWYENAAGIGTPVASVDTMLNHNLKIYAVWEALPIYDIVLTPDGEENSIFTYETVTGFESSQIYEGGQYRFKVCIASAYVIKSVKANGKVLTCEEDVYSITDVVDNMTVVVAVERLVSTQEPEDTIATIGLPDGTTGYFISLEEAVEFAIKHGSDSVIKLEKDLDTLSLEVPAGNAFTIDLNGKSVGTDSLINVSEGAELALVNNSETEPSSYDLTIENRGTVSNAIEIEEMVNYGTVYNSGTVASILQGQSETDGEISRFVNHGNIENMTLESGYYEQGENAQAGSGELPVGLTGFSTIMNGNEYYADFNDAVTIANQSDEDAEILILSDVDNTNKVVDIENTNGHTISLNLNGHSILNGSLNLAGDVAISNGEEENGKNAIISAKVSNDGDLQLDSGVKVSGAVENKGALGVNGAVISGNVNNHESATVENDGTISGVVTNNGDIVNNGTMNNVLQNAGTFDNNGNVQSQFVLNGGKYQVEEDAIPLIPTSQNTTSGSPAVKSNLNPVSYYGTMEDAIHDVNSLSDTEAPAEGLKITLLDDIEDLKESPLVIDSSIPIAIDTNGKKLGNADGSDSIEIAGGSSVSLTDTSDEDPFGEVGKVNVDIANKAGAELSIDEKITVNGDIDNAGDMNNNGTLEGTITNSGCFTNGENGDVNSLVQTGGNTENLGVIDELSVESGGITGDLEEHQDINKVAKIETQDTEGNDTVIYFSDLDSALEYAANAATEAPLTVALLQDVSGEAIELVGDKAAVVLDLNGHTIDNTSSLSVDGEASLLICDTSSTGAGAAPTGSISANIENAGTLVLEDSTTVSGDVTNHGEMTNKGTVIGDITNDGEMTNEGSLSGIVTNDGEMTNEGSLSGTVTNNGEMTNEGAVSGDIMNNGGLTNEGTVDGTIENNGDVTNQGAVGDVKQFAGSFSNGENASTGAITQSGGAITNQNTEGGISSVDLQAGSFAGTQPETPISNGEARIGDIVYGDLASAVEDANAADEAVTITLLGDVELEETEILTLENQNGKEITVDINGNSISGGTIQVGEEESSEETTPVQVSFTDSAPEEEKGTLESGLVVSERGQVGIDKDTTVSGDVTNEGKLDNTGKITGSVTNTGSLNNSDVGTMTSVNQLGGEFNNDGDVEELLVEGGEITGNEATNTSFDNAKLAVTDGETIRYYPSLEAALQDVKENESVILLADISGETVEITKSGITLDLNGHSISNDSSITIAEEAADTAITNTGEPGNAGEMAGSIINYGELAIDSSAVVAQITNEHQLQNDGTVINLTNTGDVTNNSVVENLEFVTGSFAGTEPEVSDLNPVAAIGDRFFGDLDSALEHANTATEDTTITILQDTQLPVDASISGEGGNTVTIDLNGNALSAANGGDTPSEAALNVTGNAGLEITDSSEDKTGVFAADLTVEEGAKAAVDSKVCVDGNIENEGTFENRGDILGDVSNGVTGTFENSTEDSFVGGTVCNEGDMNNAGILNGEVDNSGKLSNSGNIDNDVNNNCNATLENAGNINGQMTNADNAAISNSGAIHQVKLEGGTLDNQGDAQISNLIQNGGTVTAVGNGNIAVSATGGSVSAGADTDETIATLEQAFGPTVEVSYDEETGQYQVTLNTDVQLEAPITLDGIDVAIDLNGQNITGGIGQPAIKVAENTTIMVSDSSETGGGSIQSGDGAAQKALVIEEGGSLEIGGKLDTVDESGSSWIEADDMDGAIHDYSIRILKEPADAAVMEENSVSFAVEAESSLELTYQWYVNKNEDGWALIENEQPSLKLDVDMSMNGWQYRCIIRNEKSHVLSKVVVLTVYEKPVVPIIPVVPVGGEPEEVEDEGDASDIAPEVETRPSTGRPVSPSITDGETQTPTDNMNQEEEEEASGDTSGDTKLKDETQTEQNIQISSVEEAMNIPVLESANTLDVVLGAGEIILSLDMDGAKLSGTVGNTLKATLSEEELSAIEKGKSVEIRSTLVRYLNVSEIEDSVLAEMAQATNLYGEYLAGLNAGQYVDISLEKRIDGSDWIELHELNEELEIVVSIPEELQSDGRVYFMLRNHFGTCELLQDMDTDDLTITVLSDKFSTYQIMYIDAVAKEQIKELNLDLINNKVAMQLAANSGWLDRSGVIWIAIALLAIVSLLISYEYFGRKKRKKDE